MSVNVAFPEELLAASREDRKSFSRRVTIYTPGHLCVEGKMSFEFGNSSAPLPHRTLR